MSASTATRYPIDFDELAAGSIIAVERLERIVDKRGFVSRSEDLFPMLRLQLQGRINTFFARHGVALQARLRGDGLEIIGGDDYADWNWKLATDARRRMARQCERMTRADPAALSDEMRIRHELRLAESLRLQQAITRERREIVRERRELEEAKAPNRLGPAGHA